MLKLCLYCGISNGSRAMMATEISIPTLTGSTNYELWKLQTQAWTVATELSRNKHAVAVASM